MKAVILASGLGARISEETNSTPKPMINIIELIKFHKKHGKDATLTATYPPGRFGALDIQDNQIKQFTEKPKGDGALINGGFFCSIHKSLKKNFW